MKMRQTCYIFIFLTLILQSVCISAQTSKVLEEMRRGDSLREKYRFEEASEAYLSASEMFVDSLMTTDDSLLKLDISDRLLMAIRRRSLISSLSRESSVVIRESTNISDADRYASDASSNLYFSLNESPRRISSRTFEVCAEIHTDCRINVRNINM